MRGKAPADRFLAFLTQYKRIVVAILALGASPPLLNVILGIGPPWPDATGVSYFTTLGIWLALPWTYVSTAGVGRDPLRVHVKRLGVTVAIALFAFVALSAALVYNAPDWRHQEAAGFLLRDEISDVLEQQQYVVTLEDLVKGAEYKPTRIWIPWTVSVSRVSLLATWLVLFGTLSALTATLLRFLEREDDAEKQSELGRHIATLSLPRRLTEALQDAGIEVIGDLTKRRRGELLAIAGCGEKSVQQIEDCLKQLGLSLDSESADTPID